MSKWPAQKYFHGSITDLIYKNLEVQSSLNCMKILIKICKLFCTFICHVYFFPLFLKKWFSFQDAIWQNKLKEVQEKLNSLQHPLIKKELDEVLPELVKRKLVVLEEVPRMMVCPFYSVNFKHKDETLILSSNTVPCEIKLDFPIKYCLVIFHVLKKSSKELFTVCFAGVGNNVISYSGRLCWVHKKYLIHTSNVNIVEVRHNQSMAVH